MRPSTFFATLTFALSVYAHTGNLQNHDISATRSTVGSSGKRLSVKGFAKQGIGRSTAHKKSGSHGPSNRAAHRNCHRRGGKLIARADNYDDDDDDAMSCVTDDQNSGEYLDLGDLEDGMWDDPGTDTEPCVED
ncbi:uncharacterized protein PgNI_10069 [Pyricularia grisea]|uniref:Uncharacterized protein n=1 Tax=Pyricularia grisea TaxID=148305 RepID=A0A6P8ARY3_PYRGI|nr:uncharacterized protein PgNI_10069 [Pyricularia grisea]TLD04875.1 hypothetical protein PgNI_10069 [Pyricularia grisea]